MAANTLQDGMVGALAYTLTVDGQIVETISPEEAIEYLHGEDNLVPGLEAALAGRKAGDTFEVSVAPEDGYGEYDDDLVEVMGIDEFDNPEELSVGTEVELMDDEDNIYEAIIVALSNDEVTVDFNEPLAGKTLHYSVQVVSVREATEEEKDMGMPASLLDELFEEMDSDEH